MLRRRRRIAGAQSTGREGRRGKGPGGQCPHCRRRGQSRRDDDGEDEGQLDRERQWRSGGTIASASLRKDVVPGHPPRVADGKNDNNEDRRILYHRPRSRRRRRGSLRRSPPHRDESRRREGYFDNVPPLGRRWAGDMCQLCYHTWFNEYDNIQKKERSYKQRNRFRIQRCLVCNVNLCIDCDHSFHGVDLTAVTI